MTFSCRAVTLSNNRKFAPYPAAKWRRANFVFGATQLSIALLTLLLMVQRSRGLAANPDLETVLTGSRQRIEKVDYRVSGRLTRTDGSGKRTSYKFVGKAHWFPD